VIRFRLKAADGTVLAEKLISQFPVSFGRASSNGVAVGDAGISSKHAEIDWDGNHLHLRDLSSRNGTFVNDKNVEEMVLNLPCIFRLGSQVTVEAELASSSESSFALPNAPHKAPAVFRPTLPQNTVMRDVEPIVATVVVEPKPVYAEERYWELLRAVSPRTASGVALALAAAIFLGHYLVFRESVLESFAVAATELVISLAAGAIAAALLALPGALLRGEYSFKPLFLQLVAGGLLVFLELSLRAGFLYDLGGYGVRLLCLLIVVIGGVSWPYVFLFSTFPHKFGRQLVIAAGLITFVGVVAEGYSIFTYNRPALLHSAFVGDFHASRGLAGSQTNVKAITDDLRAFGAEHPLTR
jgi:hypothetical protein